jgi:hypothetical protein
MSRPRRFAHLAVAGGLACGCATPLRQQPEPAPVSAQDTAHLSARDMALFSVVVRAVRSDARAYRVIVDPRPLPADSRYVAITHANFARIPPAVLQARERAIRAEQVEPGDAVALGDNATCPGVFVFPERPGDDPHARCPKQPRYVVVIGLPRAGTARLPTGEVYDRSRKLAAEGHWAVRVVATVVGPAGWNQTEYDYVMKKEDARWTLVAVVLLSVTE